MTRNIQDTRSKRVFLGRLLMAPKRAGFSLVDVQSDVLSLSWICVTAFSIDQQLRRWRFVICFPVCQWGTASSRWCRVISVAAI